MIGKVIKAKRKALGLTQKELAKRVRLDQRDISIHENTRRDLSLVNKTHNRILEEFFEKNGLIPKKVREKLYGGV